VRREAHALRDAGYAVTVIAPRDPKEPWSDVVDGVRVLRFPVLFDRGGTLGYILEYAWATLAMLLLTGWVALRHGLDVIHAANPPDTLCVIGTLFRVFGVRYVFDQHDLSPEVYLSRFARGGGGLLHGVLRLLERWSYAVADAVIVTNESYRRIALRRGRKHPDKVFVVRNGPPLSYQRPVEADGAPSDRHLIGYVGTIGPQDGLDVWLRAVRELVVTLGRRDFRAVVIGDGDALPDVRALAVTLGVEDYVHFTGRLSEERTRELLARTDLCVQPDPSSPAERQVHHEQAHGVHGARQADGRLRSGGDPLLGAGRPPSTSRPNDPREFAEQVAWLLDHPQERERMGELGRHRVRHELAWEYSVPELLRAYREGLGGESKCLTEAK
jgi:glycosyltransferase involved in cell wall biosynthesis